MIAGQLASLLVAFVLTAANPEVMPPPAEQLAILEGLAPALVQVEYTLQYDKGEEPIVGGWAERCPNCGQYHSFGSGNVVTEERSLEAAGYLLSDDQVVTADLMAHPRFVKSILVRLGEETVPARPAGCARNGNALFLALEHPLTAGRPLAFKTDLTPPYLVVTRSQEGGTWTTTLGPAGAGVSAARDGRRFIAVPSQCLIVDAKGGPVGMCATGELPLDDSWKGSPLQWPLVSAEQMAQDLAALQQRVDSGVMRVTVKLRSPKKTAGSPYSRYRHSDDEEATEVHALGVATASDQVVVLAELPPAVTARLERILVHRPDGEAIPAKFVCTLADYGAFVATPETPLEGRLDLSDSPAEALRNALLLSAEVKVHGDERVAYCDHMRVPSFEVGWKGRIFPEVARPDEGLFLFGFDGKLLALPVSRREKASVRERWSSPRTVLTPAAHLSEVLQDVVAHADAHNLPLSEEEEGRLAWLGVELQALDPELARANNVSHLTQNGQTGALVSFVYPGSPAAQRGIQPGYVLLRLHVEGHPKPMEVELEEYDFYDEEFPWAEFDEIPEMYFEHIPTPWPSVDNQFARSLTELGWDTKFRADFFHGGQVLSEDFVVEKGPPHFDSAPRYESKTIGLTVRDMTYEVRRYFRKGEEDPGVIVAKVDPGSKASVAGIKPYEIIVSVNDEPVKTVSDFERLVGAEQAECRFSVLRMTRSRIVRIKGAAPAKE